ncbi:MAG: hypothetical protein H0T46_19320 [Deltaproteobacteria bacterium]|nr:hypothetical protein [Deltaproteobacteria bacterium]
METDLEVEMELVYELTADAEDDLLADALEDSWFERSGEQLAEIEDALPPESLRVRMMRLIGFSAAAAA